MYKRLGEIATYVNGYAFKPEDRGKKGLPIIRIQDLTGNSYDVGYYDGEYPMKVEINSGDILISWSASLGVYIWTKGKALLNQHIFKVVFDKCIVDKYFFVYAVKQSLKNNAQKAHGVTMKHIVKKDFDNIEIYFPEIDEQQQIAKKLSKIENIIDFRQKQLQLLDTLVSARFVEMFGDIELNNKCWKRLELKEVCNSVGDGLHGTPQYSADGRYFFINGNNLVDGLISTTPRTKKVDEEEFLKYNIKFSSNTILISINGTLGNIAFYNNEKIILGKSVCYCDFKPEILREFVFNLMKTKKFIKYMEENSTRSTIKNVGLKAMREYKLIVPPLSLQNQFADFVTQIEKSKLMVQRSLEEAQLLFDSLMQEYFG